MAPKKLLARRYQKQDGNINLEEVAAERIDAITAEPLHRTNFVEIKSPDGNLRLFYNTNTLIRIATDRGMFMQPPHFREPMTSSLQKEVESIEGRAFHFEKSNIFLSESANVNSGIHVIHRHVYFDQIMDEFYLLNPAEVYVCPACYLHWVTTRYVAHMEQMRHRLEYLDNAADPVVDPLDVLAHMHGVEHSVPHVSPENPGEEERDSSSAVGQFPLIIPAMSERDNWDSPLVHIVFRRAAHWKQHVRQHHQDTHTSAVDYRLRDLLCQYFAHFNRLADERSKRRADRGEQVSGQPELTLSRYWHVNARFNRLRYNRIVEATERAIPYISECVGQIAFENEKIMNTFHDAEGGSSDDADFICDDSESDSGSEDAGRGGYEYSEGSDTNDGESDAEYGEEDEEEDNNEETDEMGNAENGKGTQKDSHGRGRFTSARPSRFSAAQSSSSSSLYEDDETEMNKGTACEKKQQNVFKLGLLAPLPEPHFRLSYDQQRVLDSCSKRVFKPTVLYAPQPARLKDSEDNSEEEIDWSQVGGTIEDTKDYVRERKRKRDDSTNRDGVLVKKVRSSISDSEQLEKGVATVEEKDTAGISPSSIRPKLLLDDDVEIPQENTPTPAKRSLLLTDDTDSS